MPLCQPDRGEWMERIKPVLASGLFILLVLLFIVSCSGLQMQEAPAKGVYHRVKKGETVWSIARVYHVKLQDLAEINNITDLNLIEEGAVIFIPGANQVIDDVMAYVKIMDTADKITTKIDSSDNVKNPVESNGGKEGKTTTEAQTVTDKKVVPPMVTSGKPQPAKVAPSGEPQPAEVIPAQKPPSEKIEPQLEVKLPRKKEIQVEKEKFIWPVRGKVKTRFGIQPNKPYHNNSWIKIVCPVGTQVKAAASGTVIFSTRLKEFGETIIIRHEKDFATVYTHLKKRYVRADQNVKKGEAIALVGETDRAGNAYINFEIRLQGKARNPLFFLP
jgi:lipoprotein NlpD